MSQPNNNPPILVENLEPMQEEEKCIEIAQVQQQQLNGDQQSLQMERSQINSSFMLSKIVQIEAEERNAIAEDPVNISLLNQGKYRQYFEKLYANTSIKNYDLVAMARGIPSLKKKIANCDPKIMVVSLVQYLQILQRFISPQNDKKEVPNLETWQQQLFLAILDADILDLKIQVEYKLMFKMLDFLSAFQKNTTTKRAVCHLEYIFLYNRLGFYLGRLQAERKKGNFTDVFASYSQIFKKYEERPI